MNPANKPSGPQPSPSRWQKGGPSPNPNGRPHKPKREDALLAKVDPWAAMVSAFDSEMLPSRDSGGEPITIARREIAMKRLFQDAVQNPGSASMKLYVQLSAAAHQKAMAQKVEMLGAALTHQQRYLKAFEERERAGKPLPDVFPDPRDITILPDGSVSVEGPMSMEERELQNEIMSVQESQLYTLTSIAQRIEQSPNDANLKRIARQMKRKLATTNKSLPARLRRKQINKLLEP